MIGFNNISTRDEPELGTVNFYKYNIIRWRCCIPPSPINMQKKKCGIVYEFGKIYDDKVKYDEKITTMVNKEILPAFNRKPYRVVMDSIIVKHPKQIKLAWTIKFRLFLDLYWIDHIDVYVAFNGDYNYSVLTDTDETQYKIMSMSDGNITDSYKYKDNKIEYFSILVRLPERNIVGNYDGEKIVNAINSAIEEGYKIYIDKFLKDERNRDIIKFSKIDDRKERPRFWNYSDEQIKQYLEKINTKGLLQTFCDIAYPLSFGEIQFALDDYKNYVYWMLSFDRERWGDPDIRHSYMNMCTFLDKMKECVSDDLKLKFCMEYGYEYFEESYSPEILKIDGCWESGSFDRICDFYKKRINEEFISKLPVIFDEIIGEYIKIKRQQCLE